jgi:hypothetical protein
MVEESRAPEVYPTHLEKTVPDEWSEIFSVFFFMSSIYVV